MIGARAGGLQIAEEGIDRAELFQLDTSRTAAGHDPLLRCPRSPDPFEPPKAIRHHVRRGGQRRLRSFGNRFLGEFQLLQADPKRTSGLGGLHRSNERHLALRAASALAARQFATEIGVVDLDPPIQLTRRFPLAHDLHQLVLEQPGSLVTHHPDGA